MPQVAPRTIPFRRRRSCKHPAAGVYEARFVLDNDIELARSLVYFLECEIKELDLCAPRVLTWAMIALYEALKNAIFHGNLGLNSAVRDTDEKEYPRLAAERRGQAPYAGRRVHVTARCSSAELTFIVRDEGDGFVPVPTDPEDMASVSRKGILIMRICMDVVRFNKKGNEVTLVRRLSR